MAIYDMLYPYQKKIVDMVSQKSSYGLYLDMGLGKTAVSMALAERNNCTKVLVVSINSKAIEDISVDGSWLDWASKSDVGYNNYFTNKYVSNPAKKYQVEFKNDSKDVLLMNYEGLYERNHDERVRVVVRKRIVDFINSCKGHNFVIICDECHKLKSSNSLQTIAVNKIISLARIKAKKVYIYIGSGTPFTRDFEDLYSQLKMLGWNKTKQYFKDEFCIMGELPGRATWQQPIVGYKNVKGLYDIIHQYAITIKTDEVIQLPEKVFVNHVLPENKEFKFLTRDKMNMLLLQKELIEKGLPYITTEKVYDEMSVSEKEEFWGRLGIVHRDGNWIFNNEIEFGGDTESYPSLMNTLTMIYEHANELDGMFDWLYDYYYLFDRKKKKIGKDKYEYWYEPMKLKIKNKTNNPLYRNLKYPNPNYLADTAGSLWLRARQISIGFNGNAQSAEWFDTTRLNALEEFLKENEDNYILFYNFTPELVAIEEICKRLGYNIDIFYGKEKSLKFYDKYKSQSEGERLMNKKNIIIANFVSGSTGLNLQLYNKCIIFSCPIFRDYEQGIKRINRLGQKNTCFYHVFFEDNWLDRGMREALANRMDYNNNMFENGIKQINIDEDTGDDDDEV